MGLFQGISGGDAVFTVGSTEITAAEVKLVMLDYKLTIVFIYAVNTINDQMSLGYRRVIRVFKLSNTT